MSLSVRYWGLANWRDSALARSWIAALLLGCLLAALPNVLHAHGGGTPQLTEVEAGPYRLYAWTEPQPWRAGDVHISMIVTLPADTARSSNDNTVADGLEQPVTDVAITVNFASLDDPSQVFSVGAVSQASLNDVYFEADIELPSAGAWQTTISLDGPVGRGNAQFRTDVLPARVVAWPWLWGALLASVCLLAVLGAWSRRNREPESARTKRRPARSIVQSET